ncbi:MAG TPA: TolC family protein [Terriglobia bacterium]|nr:TolC family protein [Terriglobia bacterium]
MKWRFRLFLITLLLCGALSSAGETGDSVPPRHITLHEAVQLALLNNHNIHIARYAVEANQHAKEVTKSAYFPTIRNDSSFVHLTDTQLIQINPGGLGAVLGNPVPPVTETINQGGRDLTTSGTQLTQPLTTLFKIRPENEIAQADLNASQQAAQQAKNDMALKVHQLYYQVLIAQAHRAATESRIKALQDLEGERVQQVKFGSTMEENLIESQAQLLQAKQELLTTDLQLSDLKLQLNDAMGLPLATALDLDPNTQEAPPACDRETCVAEALQSHPEIIEAREEVEKAAAAVRLAKTDLYVPDVDGFARYSYQNNVPFLAHNFGSFGVHFGYDLFDSGRKRALLREREALLSQSKENLARLTDEVEVTVQTAYNKLERTREMQEVSEELLALRVESNRVLHEKLARGETLSSQAEMGTAQELEARTLLLQSQLDYIQANDEVIHAMGGTPE